MLSVITFTDAGDAKGIERTVTLSGNRLTDVDQRNRVTLSDVLRVIHHPAWRGVPTWTEIRVEER